MADRDSGGTIRAGLRISRGTETARYRPPRCRELHRYHQCLISSLSGLL
jgi:hypothetical protein